MKTKSQHHLLILLALALVLGLIVGAPLAASAEDGPFQVTEQPVGATYMLNDTADALRATFEYSPLANLGGINSQAPITVRWYWSADNSNTGRVNAFEESTVAYAREIKHTTTHVPATDTVGVKYYYAVLSYTEMSGGGEFPTYTPREAVSDPARIEVKAPEPEVPESTEQSFTVKKVDEDGKPLAGATIRLESKTEGGVPRVYDKVSDSKGEAVFTVEDGTYLLSEYAAPTGYNATDATYDIIVTPNGVYVPNSVGRLEPYTPVIFVNKEIPTLNYDDHFAYMQGYTTGDFRPASNMTRAEAVVMFSRLLDKTMDLDKNYRNNYYPDVDLSLWYANQVCYMQQKGVLADFSRDNRFRPSEAVTRAEFATLASHFDNLVLTDANIFTDVPNSHWAVKYINSAAAKGWIKGYTDGTFEPESFITRAEVVTLVNRILKRKADEAYITANLKNLPRSYSDLPTSTSHWAYWDIMESSIGHDFTKQGDADEKWTAVYK